MKRSAWVLSVALVLELLVAAQQPLAIYVIDTEGGKGRALDRAVWPDRFD